jgi:ATP-dependent Lhr-like helicase
MSSPPSASDALGSFGEPTRRWFEENFAAPTPVQAAGWPLIAGDRHALLVAPTGSGKTLAAFLACLDRLARRPAVQPGVRVLYVSPLKALVYDIERNLRAPLAGIARAAGGDPGDFRVPRVAVRTGDTPQSERRAQARDPADILVTTPESLYLILGSQQRETLSTVETIIVDEIHALAPTKRGAHLALSLERVAAACASDPQRVGLSATARPIDEIARFLGGDRAVEVVDTSEPPALDLEIRVPVPDMTRPEEVPVAPGTQQAAPEASEAPPDASILRELLARDRPQPVPSIWPAIHPELLREIRAHHSTIVFVNSRGLCERLVQRLNELAGEELVRAHHGSIAHEQRREIEEDLKSGRVRGIVATSSLELGIDMGAVDLVLLVESPGAVARGLQRVGRAGHRVGETSIGRIFPKHRGDLLEAAVVARGMRQGEIEPLRVPRNPLDVLAQQIVALCGVRDWSVPALAALVRRSASYRELSDEVLVGVLDMLSGKYPSTDFSELRARIVWDRETDRLSARPGANRVALVSGGTIPDRGQYAVHLGEDGPRIGELDEEMVHETRTGQTITLGASTWRVAQITRDRVIVRPAPGEPGRLPFWHGEGPGRPVELGRAIGAFSARLAALSAAAGRAWLEQEYGLDAWAAQNLVDYVHEQREVTGAIPTDRRLTLERFRDELGDWRICILSPFGARIHAPWALALEARLSREAGFELQTLWNDDGIVLRFADAETPPELDALLLPRRRPGARTPLWVQRLRAQNLQAVARRFPSFPIMLETYRECLQDVFDVPGLRSLLRDVQERRVRVDEVETRSASPFARSLVFAYTAQYLYQGDMPLAERRAQALTLDRHLLRDLLGQEELRELLDAEVIASVSDELLGRAPEHCARGAEALCDLLRRVGDLSQAELAERSDADPAGWLRELGTARRVARVSIAGEARWIAVEDAALYRDALGCVPPAGLPEALLAPVEAPLEQLGRRFARRRGPFTTLDLARRYGLRPAQVEPALTALEAREVLLRGEFLPGGREREWCDPEVLRRLRRRTLARLRGEVAPVEAPALARFLALWQHADARRASAHLHEVVSVLEGAALSFSELERSILPARIPDYDPRMLDELGAMGDVVWIGRGALGARDGRIALYRRERVPLLVEPPEVPQDLSERARAILSHLEARGASFASELAAACGSPPLRELMDALWDLVWAGLVTNDTFAPLRALSTRHRERRPQRRKASPAAGRWSPVRSLLGDPPSETERLHARALMLLDRYGLATRAAAHAESLPGGFAGIYDVYRAMEETGKLRRGHFVEGLEGVQFAYAGAVDALRDARTAEQGIDKPELVLLAATDPANPYGALLAWPPQPATAGPRRAVGASVVLIDGQLVLFADRGARRLLTFGEPGAMIERAAAGLRGLFRDRRRGPLRVREIDGVMALDSPHAPWFIRAGFRPDYDALVLERFGS